MLEVFRASRSIQAGPQWGTHREVASEGLRCRTKVERVLRHGSFWGSEEPTGLLFLSQ